MNEVHFVVGAATDVGRVREVNEDAHGFLHSAAGDLLVVCDGMGGHAAGDVASKAARDTLIAHVLAAPDMEPAALLRQAIQAAHMEVRNLAQAVQGRQGMGTTCVVALVRGNHATVANVGDSRCFVVQGGRTRQLSKDHTKAQALFDQRLISAEQFANHPEKGVLNQALGQTAAPDPHIDALTLGLDDYLVLCSDGVYDCLSSEQLAELTFGANPNYAADNVVREAVQRDGKDNATTVIGRYVDLGRKVVAPVVAATNPVSQVEAPARVAARPAWLMPAVFVLAGLVAGGASGWVMKSAGAETKAADEKQEAATKKTEAESKDADEIAAAAAKEATENEAARDKEAAAEKKAAAEKETARDKDAAAERKAAAEKKAAADKDAAAEKRPAPEKGAAAEKKAAAERKAAAEKKAADEKDAAAEKKSTAEKKVAAEKKAPAAVRAVPAPSTPMDNSDRQNEKAEDKKSEK